MLISEYYVQYTDQKKFGLGYALEELVELLTETATGHWREIPGEVSDISIYLQLWMYTHFEYDQQLWSTSHRNLEKVQKRKPVWQKIYGHVGVAYEKNYCGNYSRPEKLVAHLHQFGVSREKALEAYERVVVPLSKKSPLRSHF